MDALVDRQVERVLRTLERSEAAAAQMQERASRDLAHLEEQPERIRRLVEGESRSAARELTDALRERALAGDDADALVRRLVRRR